MGTPPAAAGETPEVLQALLRAALEGEPGAEERFFETLLSRVHALLVPIVSSKGVHAPDVQRDIQQEVMLCFLRRLREDTARLQAIISWDKVIAQLIWWRLMDHLRLKQRRGQVEDERLAGAIQEEDGPATVLQFLAQRSQQAWEEAQRERLEVLAQYRASAAHDADTLQIVAMRMEGLSFAEISSRLGRSENACTLRYHRFCTGFRAWLRGGSGRERGGSA
jgi:DNA-directed RNA polymerase specialized sigma24 family protein